MRLFPKPFARSIALLAALWLAAAPASRAAVVFDAWTSVNAAPGHHLLTVTDNGGRFDWELTVKPWDAEVLGLFVDLGAVTMPAQVLISNTNPGAPVSLVAKDSANSSCGPGCNLNGLSLPAREGGDWELVFRLGNAGFDGIQTFNWSTSDFGLGEDDIHLVAVRAQQLCGTGQLLPRGQCGGSDKAYAWPKAEPHPHLPTQDSLLPPPAQPAVPTPGTLALLALGVMGLIARRR